MFLLQQKMCPHVSQQFTNNTRIGIMLQKQQGKNTISTDVILREYSQQVLLSRCFDFDLLVDYESIINPVITIGGASNKELVAPSYHINDCERYEDTEYPEPEEGVDSLVEQVKGKDTLYCVGMRGAQFFCLYVTDRDSKRKIDKFQCFNLKV